ncbi:MAG: aminopeptidase [Burkholderiaceae bacterium]|nr:aminopeptidase [Burkholderiaceae bacterium]
MPRWAWLASAGTLAAGIAALCLGSGCSTLAYYGQSAAGHAELLRRARPVDDWLADPATSTALRQRLQLAREARAFAVSELALPDNASYKRYADLGRPAAVWNVVAAPELSLSLHRWCYPVMGCVGYRGYFDRAEAEAEAAALRAQGLEAFVYGVPAYSTLGWSNWLGGDPLLNTFALGPEQELVRLVFHELAHQVVFAPGDTEFNEAYATAVERLGLARWQQATGRTLDDAAAARRRDDFRRLTRHTRAALDALYRSRLPDELRRQRKAELMAELRAAHAALKTQPEGPWAGFDGYDRWFARANNAALALQAAYDGWVPAFEALFEREGRDFARFHAAVRQLASLPAEQRHATLQSLAPAPQRPTTP